MNKIILLIVGIFFATTTTVSSESQLLTFGNIGKAESTRTYTRNGEEFKIYGNIKGATFYGNDITSIVEGTSYIQANGKYLANGNLEIVGGSLAAVRGIKGSRFKSEQGDISSLKYLKSDRTTPPNGQSTVKLTREGDWVLEDDQFFFIIKIEQVGNPSYGLSYALYWDENASFTRNTRLKLPENFAIGTHNKIDNDDSVIKIDNDIVIVAGNKGGTIDILNGKIIGLHNVEIKEK